MNRFDLYRQVLQGKWFIHYSYAITMGSLLEGFFPAKEMGNMRDWDRMATMDLDQIEGRAEIPVTYQMALPGSPAVKNFNDAPEGSIAVIPLKSVMIKYGTMCEYGTEEIATRMLEAAESSKINGIVLDIDSGGGSVDAIAPMLEAISKIRSKYGKPVVACADMCASAAYYVAAHCDRIVASNDVSSEFGSIGVMMSFWDMVPYYEKAGFKFHRIYAKESTHKNLPLEKALEGKYDLIQEEELSPLAVKFQNAVKEKRGSKLDLSVEGLLNGRMFYAGNPNDEKLTAVKVGLIDEIGTLDYAVALAASLYESKTFMSDESEA